jgi:hypothetical protein
MNEHRNHRRLAGAALVTFCTSTLCGPPAMAAAAPDDACALLTQSQVSAALGVGVDPGQRPVATDPLFCNWREHGKPEGPARNVIVTIIGAARFESEKKSLVRGPTKTPEHDIGDEAYYYKAGRFPFNLIVKKDAAYFRIMARSDATPGEHSPAVDDQDKKVDRALAIEILKKL